MHRLSDDDLGKAELEMLAAIRPPLTRKKIGELLGYGRDVITDQLKKG